MRLKSSYYVFEGRGNRAHDSAQTRNAQTRKAQNTERIDSAWTQDVQNGAPERCAPIDKIHKM